MTNSLLANENNSDSVYLKDLRLLLGDKIIMKPNPELKFKIEAKAKPIIKNVEKKLILVKKTRSFLTSSSDFYTINLRTTKGLKNAKEYIKINKLDDNQAYSYEFGLNMENAKVMYGVYSSYEEAQEAMSKLPSDILKSKPYIDNVSKHQKLYAKYHFVENTQKVKEDKSIEINKPNLLLSSSLDSYTINLITTNGLKKAKKYIKVNDLDNTYAYFYEFGPNKQSAKVMYGIYPSILKAQEAMAKLPSRVLKSKPYIDNVSKHQKLYMKYHL
jgi:septal ring-binding cell division protein DamX